MPTGFLASEINEECELIKDPDLWLLLLNDDSEDVKE